MKVTRKLWTWALAVLAAFTLVLGFSGVAFAADGPVEPKTDKTLRDNGDGTYTLSLSVTGQADSSSDSSKANVIIVFDSSGSMGYDVSDTTYTENNTGRYGYRNGTYVTLYRRSGRQYNQITNDTTTGTVYYRVGNGYNAQYYEYTDQRYSGETVTSNRMVVAKNAVNALTTELFKQNSIEGQDTDTVEVAIIDFASDVKSTTGTKAWMTTQDASAAVVQRISADGGTNWEAALESAYTLAQEKRGAQPDEPVYVIFVSDGNPTFRLTAYDPNWQGNDPDDGWNTPSGVHGSGNSDEYGYNLDAAQKSAAKITGADGMELYTVGAFGDVTNMESLGGDFYDASDPQALSEAFSDIIDKITNALNVSNVNITDEITGLTATTPIVGSALDFKYYRSGGSYGPADPSAGNYGTEWTTITDDGAKEATADDSGVTWNLGDDFKLENGVTYTVTFTVWPSQEAYDVIAQLNNGDITEIPDEYESQIVKNADGSYGVKTNPENGAKIDYTVTDETTQKAVPTKHDGTPIADSEWEDNTFTEPPYTEGGVEVTAVYTKNSDGTYTITKTSKAKDVPIKNPDNTMGLETTKMKVTKVWEDSLTEGEDRPDSITFMVTEDGKNYEEITLNEANNWSAEVYIAPGIMAAPNEHGSDSRGVMPDAEGHVYTVVENDLDLHYELTVEPVHPMLDGTTTSDETDMVDLDTGEKWTGGTATFTATNTVKGGLNVVKTVTADEGVTAPEDTEFEITIKLVDAEGNPVYTNTTGSGSLGYRIFEEGTEGAIERGDIPQSGELTLAIKATQSIRIVNIPAGTKYTVSESNLPASFVLDKIDGATGEIKGNDSPTATVTNKYEVTSISVTKVWKDNDNQDGIRPDKLELTVNGLPDGITAPDPTITGTDGNTWTYTWNDLPKYDAQGEEISYTVTEEEPDGYKADNTTVAAGGTITNTHTPEVTTISVKKVWEGPEATATITLKADGAAVGDPITLPNAGSNEYTWENLPKKANGKDIVYTVAEGPIANYDTTGPTGTGTANDPFTFTNTYRATGSIQLEVTKAISGAEWPEGKSVTFTLSGEGGTLPENKTVTLSSATKGTFGAITYTEADAGKTYTYTISETSGFGTGWTKSADITAKVAVTDNGNGTLATNVEYTNNDTITNTYASSGEVELKATKALEGREWADNDEYTFTLYDKAGNVVGTPQTVNSDNKTATFETITYTQDDVANSPITYTISETIDTSKTPNVAKKSEDITVTVDLTDDGKGNITATPTYSSNGIITNTYKPDPTSAEITVTKTIDEYIPGSDKEFTFEMTPIEGAPMPEGKDTITASITTKNGIGSVTLDKITYTAAGEYKYKVVETGTPTAGWIYDTKEYTVTVTVTDDPTTGDLSATVSYGEDKTSVDVHNLFEEKSTSVKLHVDKVIEDQSASAKDATFTFVLKPGEGAPGETQTIEITTNGLKGGADFAPIEFTESGTFNYTIQETGTAPSGWTYDTKAYPVVITVSDNFETAILESATTIDDETATSLTITNVYKAGSTKSSLQVTKAIEDTSESAPDVTFEFTLATTDGSPMPDPATATVTGAGTATFGEVEYTKAGDYHYTITETKGGGAGWTNDTTTYPVVVTVTDNAGQLVATAAYGEKAETSLTVANTYDPEDAKATPKVLKTIDDQSNSAPSETFTFQLIDSKGNVVETKTRENGGPVEFSELTFAKVDTYEYTIKEVAGSTKGYTYDTADHSLSIKVEDKGDGNLEATITYADGEQATIENVYKAEPVEVKLEGIKVLEGGKKLEAGEFTFELLDNDGNKVDGTFTNDADGNIDFGTYTFEKAGTYTYTAKEAKGDNEHMTYDFGDHTFVITVTDEGGKLAAQVTGDEAELVKFTNTYTPEPVTVDPPVQKVITGDKPDTPATFTFQLKALTEGAPMPAESGNGIKTMQITGAGSKEFGEIVYTEPGEWKYEITELNGGVKGYTYDTKVYTLTVTVTQNEDGTLTKEEKIDGGDAIVFTNKYEAPKIPKTGDTTLQVGPLFLAGAVITAIAAFGARRRED